jgi:hypothetical protein
MVEAIDIDSLINAAREHTLDAHAYDIPPEHVRQAAQVTFAAQTVRGDRD